MLRSKKKYNLSFIFGILFIICGLVIILYNYFETKTHHFETDSRFSRVDRWRDRKNEILDQSMVFRKMRIEKSWGITIILRQKAIILQKPTINLKLTVFRLNCPFDLKNWKMFHLNQDLLLSVSELSHGT
mgnify:CR=1 FL=1